jgi:peroxiredoxin
MRWLLYVLILTLGSCRQPMDQKWQGLELKQTDGSAYYGKSVMQHRATVFIFFAPECPLSENYTLQTNQLNQEFESAGIDMKAVVTGSYYSHEEITQFILQYDLEVPVLLDPDKQLAKLLQPLVTPEAFVVNQEGNLVYRGAIDNWAVDLGKKREVVTEFYLRDVLRAVIQGEEIPYSKTTAVGCFIE